MVGISKLVFHRSYLDGNKEHSDSSKSSTMLEILICTGDFKQSNEQMLSVKAFKDLKTKSCLLILLLKLLKSGPYNKAVQKQYQNMMRVIQGQAAISAAYRKLIP